MKHVSLALVASLSTFAASAQCDCPPIADRPIEVISDVGQGTGTDTWTCQKTYILDGYVFVNAGQALTIEAGTVVKGASGSGVYH